MTANPGDEGRDELVQQLERSVRKHGRFVDTTVRVQFAVFWMSVAILVFMWSELDRGGRTLVFVSCIVVQTVGTAFSMISGGHYRRAIRELTARRRL